MAMLPVGDVLALLQTGLPYVGSGLGLNRVNTVGCAPSRACQRVSGFTREVRASNRASPAWNRTRLRATCSYLLDLLVTSFAVFKFRILNPMPKLALRSLIETVCAVPFHCGKLSTSHPDFPVRQVLRPQLKRF
jgi:hypothetical protein